MRSVVVSMLPPAHAAANEPAAESTGLRIDQFLFSRKLSTEPQARYAFVSVYTQPLAASPIPTAATRRVVTTCCSKGWVQNADA
jgi:hypothetical protein